MRVAGFLLKKGNPGTIPTQFPRFLFISVRRAVASIREYDGQTGNFLCICVRLRICHQIFCSWMQLLERRVEQFWFVHCCWFPPWLDRQKSCLGEPFFTCVGFFSCPSLVDLHVLTGDLYIDLTCFRFQRTKYFGGKCVRRTKFSAASQILGSFARRNFVR